MLSSQQERSIARLKERVAPFSKVNTEQFVQREKLGEVLSFEPARPVIDHVIELFRRLGSCSFEPIPYQLIDQCAAHAEQATNILTAILNFSPTAGNPESARNDLISSLEQNYNTWFTSVSQILVAQPSESPLDYKTLTEQTKLALQAQVDALDDIRRSREEGKSRLEADLEQIRKSASEEGSKKLHEIEEALSRVRQLASEAGVSQHAGAFDDESKRHSGQSYVWLAAMFGFGVLLLLYAFGRIVVGYDDSPNNQIWTYNWFRSISERVTLLVVLVFGLIWCARNYAASKHNEVVNRHRSNALRSFETFAKATNDESTKNAVLIQATQSIFAPQTTGYVKADGENQATTPIIELIRGASGGGKKNE